MGVVAIYLFIICMPTARCLGLKFTEYPREYAMYFHLHILVEIGIMRTFGEREWLALIVLQSFLG